MYSLLHGTLLDKYQHPLTGESQCVVLVAGIGYEVACHSRCLQQLPALNELATLYTHTVVREDYLGLVGFAHRSERDVFRLLLSASGVGQKVALALLEALPIAALVEAVLAEDAKALTVAKGVGPKLAKQMVLDLKEKLEKYAALASLSASGGATGGMATVVSFPQCDALVQEEVTQVVLALGYTLEEVTTAFTQVQAQNEGSSTTFDAETLLRAILKYLV
ncbi:MAG: Holliday junction branch migration protein RuvA [Vampirovibrionales bacterium]